MRLHDPSACGNVAKCSKPALASARHDAVLAAVGEAHTTSHTGWRPNTICSTNSAIIVLTPLIFSAAKAAGIDAIHLGTIIVANVALGMVSPPFGLNLFVGITTFRVSYREVVVAVLPFIAVMLTVLAIITYLPAVALFLPNLLK